jgi:glutamate synthase domain-containing protein 1
MPLNQAILDRTESFRGLYDPSFEHDACGVGLVASIKGARSNSILKKALTCVCNLIHRGAMDADAKTGDGAGVLTQIPYKLFRPEVEKMGYKLFQDTDLGVGMMFLPNDPYTQARCRHITETVLNEAKLFIFGWRVVPVNRQVLGEKALRTCPDIEQILIGRPDANLMSDDEFERKLFLCRNQIEDMAESQGIKDFYIPSFSSRTIVYKGLLAAPTLERFYLDLRDPNYTTALAIFHQRYSTNTFPTWPLSQACRMLATTAKSTRSWATVIWTKAREPELKSAFFGDAIKKLRPIIQPGGSDSSSLDNALEVARHGRPRHPAFDAHARARRVAGRCVDAVGREGILRVPPVPQRAVGRSRRAGLQRWPHHRRVPRPQRPAPRALQDHRRRPAHARLRGRPAHGR